MSHDTEAKTKTIDRDAVAAFWERERAALPERNRACIARRATDAAGRVAIVVTCMDERNTHIDEALGFAPGEAEVYASGGGKIDADTFDAAYGPMLAEAAAQGRPASVFLVPHECSHADHLGCAAFANDKEAQRTFFTSLKAALKERHPAVPVHVMAMCTTTHKMRGIDHDEDAALDGALGANAAFDMTCDDVNHAGHGIYVGAAYRAWVPERNAYFHLSAFNPALAGNIGIALTVMEHHSDVDLSTTPIVVQVDYPRFADATRAAAARANMDRALDALMADAAFRAKLDAGALKMVKTETDVATWEGKVL
jgi:hypothetical protein